MELLAPIVPELDLRGLDVGAPIPAELLPETTNASLSGLETLRRETAEGRTIREIYTAHANARGQHSVAGTPEEIADMMAAWFEAGAVDGFLIQPHVLPGALEDFVEQVVPALRARGAIPAEPTGGTLRARLGLERPPDRCAGQPGLGAADVL